MDGRILEAMLSRWGLVFKCGNEGHQSHSCPADDQHGHNNEKQHYMHTTTDPSGDFHDTGFIGDLSSNKKWPHETSEERRARDRTTLLRQQRQLVATTMQSQTLPFWQK